MEAVKCAHREYPPDSYCSCYVASRVCRIGVDSLSPPGFGRFSYGGLTCPIRPELVRNGGLVYYVCLYCVAVSLYNASSLGRT